MEHSQQPFSNIRRNRLQSSDEVSQKVRRVAIPFVQRQPGDANLWFASLATGGPFADQRRFTKTSGRRDEGHAWRAVKSFVQSLDQTGTEDNVWPGQGNMQFRGQDWRGHRTSIQQTPQNLMKRRSGMRPGVACFISSIPLSFQFAGARPLRSPDGQAQGRALTWNY